ncbi:MAG: endoribonuclease L-PSP [Planctomycetia bacterium]|nr:endoribonuclease L-PSP [Planctomycetia bacterium]
MLQPSQGSATIRRGHIEGCTYSLVDKNGVDFFYGISTPIELGDTRTQIFSALNQLKGALDEVDATDQILTLNFFLREIGDKQLVREILHAHFHDLFDRATTFIAQKPCDDKYALVIEAVAANSSFSSENSIPVTVWRKDEKTTILEFDDLAFGFFGGFIPDEEPIGAYARSFSAFAKMRSEIEQCNFRFPQVFRTWLYQGNIVLPERDTQRYKELNRARSDFFYGVSFIEEYLPKNVKLGAIYPASTGIGADDVDVAMSCVALQTEREDVIVVPMENPNQISAFNYAQRYSPKSPKFARAMALAYNDRCSVYVSGTASIVDQTTVHIGDPVAQTNQTLDNIEALISESNLASHGITGFDANLKDLVVARVYVKNREHFDVIREVCQKRMPEVPLVYTFADVCRDDLLVEVEGVVACNPTGQC